MGTHGGLQQPFAQKDGAHALRKGTSKLKEKRKNQHASIPLSTEPLECPWSSWLCRYS